MVLVRFRQTYFGPSPKKVVNKIFNSVSGKRYRKYDGTPHTEYDVSPEDLKTFPKELVIIVGAQDEVKVEKKAPAPSLKDFSVEHAAAEDEARVLNEVSEATKK